MYMTHVQYQFTLKTETTAAHSIYSSSKSLAAVTVFIYQLILSPKYDTFVYMLRPHNIELTSDLTSTDDRVRYERKDPVHLAQTPQLLFNEIFYLQPAEVSVFLSSISSHR